ncbi:MAG: hypothetical protein J6N52_08235 [Clostridia bacterium]|nr:hypothetical protein [Clostridia bacterium]
MIIAQVTMPSVLASDEETWLSANQADISWFAVQTNEGKGSRDNPYIITTAAELAGLSALSTAHVNGDTDANCTCGRTFKDKYIKIADGVKELDMGAYNCLPIGVAVTFKGNFDGNNVPIRNVRINMAEKNTHMWLYNFGFFGAVDGGSIKNVILPDFEYTAVYSPNGNRCIGGLVGKVSNGTEITNCHVRGKIDSQSNTASDKMFYAGGFAGAVYGAVIRNCDAYTRVDMYETQSGDYTGGFVGAIEGSGMTAIENCYAKGYLREASTTPAQVGGFAGRIVNSNALIRNSHANVDTSYNAETSYAYIGGFIGRHAAGGIENCVSWGNVVSDCTSSWCVGGFSANTTAVSSSYLNSNAKVCVNYSQAATTAGPGGDVTGVSLAENTNALISSLNSWAADMTELEGIDYKSWKAGENSPEFSDGGYAFASEYEIKSFDESDTPGPEGPTKPTEPWFSAANADWFRNPTHEGTKSDPYIISSAEELAGLSIMLSGHDGTCDNGTPCSCGRDFAGKYIKISDSADFIDLSGKLWTTAGTYGIFKGSFDGNNKTIKNVIIDVAKDGTWITSGGFFGRVENAEIKNLKVEGVEISAVNSSNVERAIGGIVGRAKNSVIDNCSVSGAVTAVDSAETSKNLYVGGLIGKTEEGTEITNSSAKVDIDTTKAVSGDYVGGFIGGTTAYTETGEKDDEGYSITSAGKIINCFAAGNVKESSSSSTARIGGFMGMCYEPGYRIENCYSVGNTENAGSAWEYTGGFTGYCSMGHIKNCYAWGNVTQNANAAWSTGLFSGFADDDAHHDTLGFTRSLRDCYVNSAAVFTVNGSVQTHGLAGGAASTVNISKCHAQSAVYNLNHFVYMQKNTDYNLWILADENYPVFNGAWSSERDNEKIEINGNTYSAYAGKNYSGDVIFAAYDSNGVLLDVCFGVEDESVLHKYNAEFTVTGIKTVKVFFIENLTTLKPLMEPYKKTLGSGEPEVVLQTDYYVDINGSDENDGTKEMPFASIERAKKAAAQNDAEGDITIHIGEGIFYQSEALEFNVENSGKNGYNVIYEGEGADKTIISGGVNVANNFSQWSENPEIYVMSVPSNIDSVRELYINGEKRYRAQSSKMFKGIKRPDATDTDEEPYDIKSGSEYIGFYMASDEELSLFKNPEDVEFVWVNNFAPHIAHLSEIKKDSEGRYIVTMQSGWWSWARIRGGQNNNNTGPSADTYFQIRNALELLDSEGEFYFDRAEKKLYYAPAADENIKSASVVIPKLDRAVSIIGNDIDDKVSNITFKNLGFAHYTSDYLDDFGAQVGQATSWTWANGHRSPSAIYIERANNINFCNNHFFGFNAAAIDMINSVENSSIIGNTFSEIGDTAVIIGSPAHIKEASEAPPAEKKAELVNLIDAETPIKLSYTANSSNGWTPTMDFMSYLSKDGGYFVHDNTYIDNYSVNNHGTWIGEASGKRNFVRYDFNKKYNIKKIVVGFDMSKNGSYRSKYCIKLSNDKDFKTFSTVVRETGIANNAYMEYDISEAGKYRYMKIETIDATPIALTCVYAFTDNVAPYTRFERCRNIRVENNYLRDIGVESFAGGIHLYFGDNIDISHNSIENVAYSGIMSGWSWNNTDLGSSNVNISYNRIENHNTAMPDGGGIYTLGWQENSSVTNNFVDRSNLAYGAFYTDQGTKGMQWNNNAAQNTRRILHLWTSSVTGNTITNTYGAHGIYKNAATDCTVDDIKLFTSGNPRGEAQNIYNNSGILAEYSSIKNLTKTSTYQGLDERAVTEKYVDKANEWSVDSLSECTVAEIEYLLENAQAGQYKAEYINELSSMLSEFKNEYYTDRTIAYLQLRSKLAEAKNNIY